MSFTKEDVSKIYIATFNRAPDALGLDYWVNNSGFTDIEDVAKSFFDSAEAQQIYTANQSNSELVNLAYQNLFKRDAKQEGLDYWVSQLDNGDISQSLMLQALINGALGDDKTIMENKTEVGISFADAGLEDTDMAKDIMLNITSDSSTVESAIAIIDSQKISYSAKLASLSNLDTFGVSALYSQTRWDESLDTITYSFNSSIPNDYYEFIENENDAVLVNGWLELNDEQKNATRDIFNDLEKLIDIKFQEVSSDGLIQLNMVEIETNTAGFSFYPGENFSYDGDVFLSTSFNSDSKNYGLASGEFGYSTIVHELGHAMGLKHPFEGEYTLPKELDDINHSIMSYTTVHSYVPMLSFSKSKIFIDYKELQPQFYSLYDIATLQAIYGVNSTTNAQDNTYTMKYEDYKIETIWDAGGVDTIDLTNTIGDTTLNLNSGSLNSVDQYTLDKVIDIHQNIALENNKEQHNDWIAETITDLYNNNDLYTGIDNLGIAYGTIIENIYTGIGDDIITDNEVDNIIKTSDGDDKIYLGNGGYDKVDGGDGEDTIYLNILKDDMKTFLSDGYSYTLQADSFVVKFVGIENIEFSDGVSYTPDDLLSTSP